MAAQSWFVVRDGKEEGPFTGTALKDMAASGKLQPGDLVRRDDVETARPASQIKGLFPADGGVGVAPTPKPPADQPTGAASSSKKPLIIMAAVAAVLVLLCGGVGVLVTVFNKEKQAAQKELAEADGLWASGDKAGAAAKYRALLQNRSRKNTVKGELAPVYGRLIDYEIERGNREAAKALLDEATTAKITPTVSHPDAKALLASGQAEARAEATKKDQGKTEKKDGTTKGKPSETELIQLLAKTAVVAASKKDLGNDVDPEAFNELMRIAAKELGAGKDDSTKHLLQIEPASRKEVMASGKPSLVVRYGDGLSRTWAGFIRNASTGRWQLFMAQFGDEEWNAVTGLGKAKQ